jgi:hypothetical protein
MDSSSLIKGVYVARQAGQQLFGRTLGCFVEIVETLCYLRWETSKRGMEYILLVALAEECVESDKTVT